MDIEHDVDFLPKILPNYDEYKTCSYLFSIIYKYSWGHNLSSEQMLSIITDTILVQIIMCMPFHFRWP